jgi:hypothetical protein
MATKIKTPTQWASAFLGSLGLPDSKTNVNNIVGWEGLEGGNWDNTATDNPLNTSEQESGSTNYQTGQPGSGVQAYTSWQSGLDATDATIQSPDYGYPEIIAALNTSQPWSDFFSAISASDWDAGHYGGDSSSTAPTDSSPDAAAYGIGSNATTDNGSSANSPSTKGATKFTGMAGILQAMDEWYNPAGKSWSLDPLTDIQNIGGSIENTAIMIFTRATSAILAIGLVIVGVNVMLRGDSSGGGSSPQNVLEFVNDTQQSNTRLAQSSRRLDIQDKEATRRSARAEWSRVHGTPWEESTAGAATNGG